MALKNCCDTKQLWEWMLQESTPNQVEMSALMMIEM